MAIERKWESVSQLFTSNGTIDGIVPVLDASGFFAKQKVILESSAITPGVMYEVRRVTATSIQVGELGSPFTKYANISSFLLADGASITAPEQEKPTLKPDEIWQAVYQKDPALALRNLLVNKFGIPLDTVVGPDGRTRLAVDAAVTVTGVTVDLDAITPSTKPDPDNVLIAGSEDGLKTGIKHAARVDSELDLRVGISDGANKANVNAGGELSVKDTDTQLLLADVLAQLQSGSLSIGTEDGTETGPQHVFVNNLKSMILASHDRVRDVTYLDPASKKNRRVEKFEFTSATFPGITLVREFNYDLIGTEYVFINDNWNLI